MARPFRCSGLCLLEAGGGAHGGGDGPVPGGGGWLDEMRKTGQGRVGWLGRDSLLGHAELGCVVRLAGPRG